MTPPCRVQGVVEELRGMACICGDAIAEGLRALEPGEPDTKRGFRAAQRCIDLVHELSNRCARGACIMRPPARVAAPMPLLPAPQLLLPCGPPRLCMHAVPVPRKWRPGAAFRGELRARYPSALGRLRTVAAGILV